MATIESLAARLPSDLEALLMDPAAMAALEQSLVDRVSDDINEQAGNEARRVGEAYFGRGMGLSSLNAYAQGQVEAARAKALKDARIEAHTNALSAQRAAVGQAAAHVNAQQARQQQADQFGRTLKHQKSLNTQNLIGGGLAGLAGGIAKGGAYMFGPEIKSAIKGFFSGGEGGDMPSPYGGGFSPADFPGSQDVAPEAIEPATEFNYESPGGFEDLDMGGYAPEFDLGGGDDFGGGLGDLVYEPGYFDMSGWGDLSDLMGNDNEWGEWF